MSEPSLKFLKSLLTPLTAMVVVAAIGQGIEVGFSDYVKIILLFVCANIILALSLNLVNGFTGQFSIGHAGFMAIGAYVSGYLSTEVIANPSFPHYLWFAFAGGLAAAVAGWLVGLPSLRLRGDYLAIVTLGFGEIIRVVLLNMPSVGGARGMAGIPRPGSIEVGAYVLTPFYLHFLLSAFWVVVTFIVLWRLTRSIHGRSFLSVREDEIAAQAMGIDTTKVKVRAFVISSFFAGIAGTVLAHSSQYINPSMFSFARSVDAIIMVVLGGMGSLSGSVFAAIVVTLLPEFVLRPLQELLGLSFDPRMVIYSLALILFMIARPQGIFGTRELNDLWRRNERSS
jgi:branched-chain amino acid transport system permease protein